MSEPISLIEKYTQDGKILKILDDYDRDKVSNVFRKVVKKTAGSFSNISGFNNWVTNILPKQIEKFSFTSEDGIEVILTDILLHNPKRIVDGQEVLVYPQFCRERKYPYTGKLEITCITKNQKGEEKRMEKIILGQIPIMLGSIKCNLYNKTPEELVELGECISDPFGYFIISSERTVIAQDKARNSLPLVIYTKSNPKPIMWYCYMTNKLTILKLGKKWNTIKLCDPRYVISRPPGCTKTFPIFIIFKLLENLEPDKAVEKYILKFIPEVYHRRAKNVLSESIIKAKNIVDPVKYIYNKRYKYKTFSDDINQNDKDEIINDLEQDLFINITESNREKRIELKLSVFSYMIAKYVLYIIGVNPTDSRDSWMNKRFETAPVLMKTLFNCIFNRVIQQCKKSKGTSSKVDYFSFGVLLRTKSPNILKADFETSFNTDNWGSSKAGFNRENHADSADRDTPLSLWSQITKNNSSVNPNVKSPPIRQIQPSQRNRHCIIETPENKNIGIVKYNAVTNVFSIQREHKKVIDFISKYCNEYDEEENNVLVLINFIPFLKNNKIAYTNSKTKDLLVESKRKGEFFYDIEINYNKQLKSLEIYSDSSRSLCPYFIVNKYTNNLVIDEKNGWNFSFDELLENGCIEFLSATEENDENVIISTSVKNFYNDRKTKKYYSHVNLDPIQMFSISASVCPMSNRQPTPRSTFQSSMGKQALGFFNIRYDLRFDSSFKQLYKATRSFCETDTYFIPKMDLFPSGQTANVAFYADPDNQEDAVILSEDFVNSGNLNYTKYVTIKYIQPIQITGAVEKIQIPPLRKNEDPSIYKNICDNGLPKLDTYIRKGDCVIGKVLIKKDGSVINNSIFAQIDEEGYVDRIMITKERDAHQTFIKVKLKSCRKYVAGDKTALRYAQKGTIGRVVPRDELLRVSSGPNKGIVPDVVFNPHGFPSRQTAGLLIEGIMTKAALYSGKRVDVSAFRDIDIEGAQKILKDNGLDPGGYEDMETSSGDKIKNKIYLVPLYEQALRHHVMDKIQMRSTGIKSLYTHQPIGGRVKGSGLKAGEMEKDAFVAHGVSNILRERLMKSADEFKLLVCGNCGTIINSKTCNFCNKSDPGILIIPYVFKVLIHLLNGIGIEIRLNTKRGEQID